MESKNKQDFTVGDFLQLAGSIPASILLGFFLGRYIDNRLGTAPTFLFLFILLGIVSAYWSIYKLAKRERKNKNGK